MDWTNLTRNPTDRLAIAQVAAYLASRREVVTSGNRGAYMVRHAADQTVLDIGVCEHTVDHAQSTGWMHRRIKEAARRVVGVDILEDMSAELRRRGYDVRCVDATSDVDLGERFERVLIGDVVEHVDNPVALLRFAGRHLAADGLVLVSTPNPHYYLNCRTVLRGKALVPNLEHVRWISPAYALEIGRRAGLHLIRYTCFINRTRLLKLHLLRRQLSEAYSADYVFTFGRTGAELPDA